MIVADPSVQQLVELAVQHHLAGRHREAETLCRLALQRDPHHPDALHLLGMLAHRAGRPVDAISLIGRAIALNPADATYPNNLGMILRSLGRHDEAISAYARSIALAPGIAQTHYNLANALKDLGKLDEAIASYRAAIKLGPNFPDAYNNLATALKAGGQIEAAMDAYRKSLDIQPSPEVEGNLLYALHFNPVYGPADILRQHVRWNDRYARPFAATIQPHANERSAHRRLRLGYISADFRYHPVGRFLQPLFAEHDHGDFEVFCYSDVTIPDAVTQDLRQHADCWREVAGLSHEQLAEVIRSDRIDILIDLSMHLEGTRLMTFAQAGACTGNLSGVLQHDRSANHGLSSLGSLSGPAAGKWAVVYRANDVAPANLLVLCRARRSTRTRPVVGGAIRLDHFWLSQQLRKGESRGPEPLARGTRGHSRITTCPACARGVSSRPRARHAFAKINRSAANQIHWTPLANRLLCRLSAD